MSELATHCSSIWIYLFPVALIAAVVVAASSGYHHGFKRGYDEGYTDAKRFRL